MNTRPTSRRVTEARRNTLIALIAAFLGFVAGWELHQPPSVVISFGDRAGTTIESKLSSVDGLLAYGTCEAASSTKTCTDSTLGLVRGVEGRTIAVRGQPARCVSGLDPATRTLSWPDPLPQSAAGLSYVLFTSSCELPRQAAKQPTASQLLSLGTSEYVEDAKLQHPDVEFGAYVWIDWLRSRVHFRDPGNSAILGYTALVGAVDEVNAMHADLIACRGPTPQKDFYFGGRQ